MRATFLLLPLAAALAQACSAQCSEPTYGGTATDEAWLSLEDALKRATVDDVKASRLTVPAPAATLSVGGPSTTFAWDIGLVAQAPARPGPAAPAHAGRRLLDLLLPSAHAHGTPMAGAGTLVDLKVDGLACAVRHLTSKNSWTPSEYDWSRLAGQKNKPLTVELTAAYFSGNRVTEGPYVPSAQVTVQLVP